MLINKKTCISFYSVIESPIKSKDLMKSHKLFTIEQINNPEYWQIVKVYIHNQLGYRKLNGPVAHSLCRIRDRFRASINSPRPPTIALPKEDAAFLVLNKPRKDFDFTGFFNKYPSCVGKIKEIRQKMRCACRVANL